MAKSRRLVAIWGLLLICAVVGHNIKFVSIDGLFFAVGVVLICFSIGQRKPESA
jgi:uncharacterized membrane protein